MYGRIVKLVLKPGKRDEIIELLKSSGAAMPDCLSCVVARDSSDADVLRITEVWENEESHQASLSLSAMRAVVLQAKALLANFERVAITEPLWDGARQNSRS
jgi:quinol monooxygenase YgiN